MIPSETKVSWLFARMPKVMFSGASPSFLVMKTVSFRSFTVKALRDVYPYPKMSYFSFFKPKSIPFVAVFQKYRSISPAFQKFQSYFNKHSEELDVQQH